MNFLTKMKQNVAENLKGRTVLRRFRGDFLINDLPKKRQINLTETCNLATTPFE